MSDLVKDVRFALRGLGRRPATSLLLVTTLALGLAANGLIFNVLDALVLRAFDFPNQSRLVRVHETSPDFDSLGLSNVAPANLIDWQAQTGEVFRDLVGLEWWDASLRGSESAERIQGHKVGPGFFEALGVAPAQGRGFLPEDAQPGRERRAVLGYALWQRYFGGKPIVGESVTIDGEPFVVIGIAPPGLEFPDGTEIWAPLVLPAAAEARRDQHYLSALGRLRDGRTLDDARAALALVAARLAREHAATNERRGTGVSGFSLGFGDPVLPQILVIWQIAAALVLLIACVNVANLILAQSAERRRELALRVALGAGPGRVARQLLTEGVVAALAAVALAMPLQALGSRALRENMPAEVVRFVPGWHQLGADWRSLLFSAAVAVVAAGLFSALPAWRAARPDLGDALGEGGRSVGTGLGRGRGRNLLVVGQMTAALVLLATASQAVRSADALRNGPQGFEPAGVLAFDVRLSETRYAEPAKRRRFVREVEERLLALPGVTSVAVANTQPGRGGYSSRAIEVEGQPVASGSEPPQVEARSVSAGLFATLRIPLVAGRGLEASDDEDSRAVAVVSRKMAERFWPGEEPIGKRFRVVSDGADAPWLSVVGVSGDVVHQWLARRHAPTFYRPYSQAPSFGLGFALRTSGEPEALSSAVRRAVGAVDLDQPTHQVSSLPRSIRQSTIGLQYIAAIMAAFGGLALLLAVSGVYGVMSYRVSRRTLEIGVRVALGASRGDVLRLTLGQALRLSALGLVLGAGLAWAAARGLGSVLRGAVAFEPTVLAAVVGLLGVSALVAAFVPARRALAVDPARALRSE